ncbi:MAG TPA: ACT domain-containing protein [Rhizobiales bacterium]|nr:ACT domain-containing protein [Hyphomicrobiales bacterium]
MAGETELGRLLAGMRPVLAPATYVFVTVAAGERLPDDIDPVMTFRESEGLTLVVSEAKAAAARLRGAFPCRLITLQIHSSLDAVGFLAAVTAHLAARGIGVNPVAAFHHDHLFVPAGRADEALAALKTLADESSRVLAMG